MTKPNLPKIEADAIFYSIMTCLPAVTQAYRYFRAQGKTEEDFDRCAHEAMTKAVRNAVQLTAREVQDPVWPYALEDAPGARKPAQDVPPGKWQVDMPDGLYTNMPGDPPGPCDLRKVIGGYVYFVTPHTGRLMAVEPPTGYRLQKFNEEMQQRNAGLPVLSAGNPARDQGPCTVCGVPWAKHGSAPTCASHDYTPVIALGVGGKS